MINIVFSDSSGGVKSVSEALSQALGSKNIPNSLFNMREFRGGFLRRLFFTVKTLYSHKGEIFILQHFDAIFLGLILRLFGFGSIINVVHIDLVTYYNSIGLVKKAIVRLMFFLIRNQKIIFVSKEAEQKSRYFFNLTNTCTIYNIKEVDFVFIGERCGSKITLGSISRLHTVKNIDLIVRVLSALNKKDDGVELLIYGDGDQNAYLKEYIHRLGCSDFVKMMGPSSNKKKMYDSIDALVSFSSIEGLPTVILESISYGKPVLYTDCSSGPRELMSPESDPLIKTDSYEKTSVGYLVKPVIDVAVYSDVLSPYEEEYVDILERFIIDVRDKKFSMEYDPSEFSESVVVDKWLKIIDEL